MNTPPHSLTLSFNMDAFIALSASVTWDQGSDGVTGSWGIVSIYHKVRIVKKKTKKTIYTCNWMTVSMKSLIPTMVMMMIMMMMMMMIMKLVPVACSWERRTRLVPCYKKPWPSEGLSHCGNELGPTEPADVRIFLSAERPVCRQPPAAVSAAILHAPPMSDVLVVTSSGSLAQARDSTIWALAVSVCVCVCVEQMMSLLNNMMENADKWQMEGGTEKSKW